VQNQAWTRLGEKLGLVSDGPWLMRGRRHGQAVQLRRAAEAQGSTEAWDVQCIAELPFLNLGLCIRGREQGSEASQVAGQGAFDAAFVVEAADPERVRAMLSCKTGDGADIVDLCTWAVLNEWALRVTDDAVVLSKRIDLQDEGEPGQALGMATRLAVRMLWARRVSLPSAWEQDVLRGWTALARARALELQPERLLMRGRVGAAACEVALVAFDVGTYGTVALAHLEKPLQVDLQLGRGGTISAFDRYMGMLDMHLGVEFERLYSVRGCPPDRARRLMKAPVRTALLALLRRGASIEVTDTTVRVEIGQVLDDQAVEGLLVDLSAAAMSLQQASAGQ
jgi:hypothetical protein